MIKECGPSKVPKSKVFLGLGQVRVYIRFVYRKLSWLKVSFWVWGGNFSFQALGFRMGSSVFRPPQPLLAPNPKRTVMSKRKLQNASGLRSACAKNMVRF